MRFLRTPLTYGYDLLTLKPFMIYIMMLITVISISKTTNSIEWSVT